MNIDERLEKLTERHEALTRTVELHDHQIGRLLTLVAGQAKVARRQQNTMDDVMDAIARVVSLTNEQRGRINEQTDRLNEHEGRLEDLEKPSH